jgi:hypothetical protein
MLRKISIALVIAGLVLTSVGVSQARDNGGRGHGGSGGASFAGRPTFHGHPGFAAHPGFVARPGFAAHPGFVARPGFAIRPGFAPHRHFHRGGGVFVGVAPFVVGGAIAYGAAPYYYDPGYAYSAPAPSYYYYCQSAGAYYPDVPSCAEPWVPVPAQ